MVNVICIKWGNLYGPEYVNKLFSMTKTHLTIDFRFACMTDNPEGIDKNVEIFPIPELRVPAAKSRSPWKKLTLLSEHIGDLSGKTLFLDLDVVILDSLDPLFEYADEFTIIENWTQRGRGIGNSSVFCFEIGKYADVLDYYKANVDAVIAEYDNEQTFISKKIDHIKYWPEEWCRSFKFHSIPKGPLRYLKEPTIPKGCKILAFHGHPNPDQAIIGDYGGRITKYFKAATWLERYWR